MKRSQDWIAVHVVDFFNRVNIVYATVVEKCTVLSCPKMSGGVKYEYLWADGILYKKPTRLPANQYISVLMDWIEAQINDESSFPVMKDVSFPKNFIPSLAELPKLGYVMNKFRNYYFVCFYNWIEACDYIALSYQMQPDSIPTDIPNYPGCCIYNNRIN
ncbi:MOB kinase activator-like 3,MOB kinase activator 3A,MOB kinase activator 3C,MOB kinase activator 3B [Lepeophtheirus salmonis]|uniref:MOB kinase activator-like 3,MOB kinase activator 3A,MOB kinase activator 3C,MOB kinase activator 3B n=1 Tax=Lepeophtheirus salmonis TaxID=72036 RepID=A0A7R8D4B1_LEPSM|nr:MOB kinase activator-like 3,MOB kinase activator 3A,MOB kinase activator 3C,MOB kinase activator 3B [Lepeophtheirus salmonis]CAF2992615.1 MOB kinase activator-like 3,MOB kinase activator 3A,MOB kinase activator 3C,MOB kinase activator 3B [Lepeophtheirus salmonis]